MDGGIYELLLDLGEWEDERTGMQKKKKIKDNWLYS